jgi:hypothetical protein
MTRALTGPVFDSSFRPSCSRSAVGNDGPSSSIAAQCFDPFLGRALLIV